MVKKSGKKQQTNTEFVQGNSTVDTFKSNLAAKSDDGQESKENVKGKQTKPSMGNLVMIKQAVQRGVPHVKCKIPKAYPIDLTIEVSQLPEKCKPIEIVEIFNKYGAITYIENVSKQKAFVAFSTKVAADAALQAGRASHRIGNQTLKVNKRIAKKRVAKDADNDASDRTVYVFNLSPATNEAELSKQFASCGLIESIKFVKRSNKNYAIINFKENASAQTALDLHNNIIDDKVISVRLKNQPAQSWDIKRTIVLLNVDNLIQLEGSKLTKIFSKCGEIENCDVLCSKRKLAMIKFKDEASVEKALYLNGATQDGIKLEILSISNEIERNSVPSKAADSTTKDSILAKYNRTQIVVKNVPKDVTETEMRNVFEACGPIKNITLLPKQAFIQFDNNDGYCNAFLLHEEFFRGQRLYIMPFTEAKSAQTNIAKGTKPKNGKRSGKTVEKPSKKLKRTLA